MRRAQLEANGLTVHYTEDTSVLSAETLKDKKVLVILKDGGWPPEDGQWMTPEQEVAIEEWVLAGGGLMPLHNSLWAIPGWCPIAFPPPDRAPCDVAGCLCAGTRRFPTP